jgi:hypothetical protein
MANFDKALLGLEQGSELNIEQIIATYFYPQKTTLEQGQVVDLYHTDGERLIGFIEKLVPKQVMLQLTAQATLTGHDREMLVTNKDGRIELNWELICDYLNQIGQHGFAFLERGAGTEGLSASGHYWGNPSTKYDVAADIVALHPNSKDYNHWVNFFESTGFAMQFNLRWRLEDGTFLHIPKAIISILEYAMLIMDTERNIARAGIKKEEISGMLYASNGQIIPNFAALVAEGLGLNKDCLLVNSINGCPSLPVGFPGLWEEAQARNLGGYFLNIADDCFVSFTDKTVIYPSAKAIAGMPANYQYEDAPDGRKMITFSPTEEEGLAFFSAATSSMLLSPDHFEMIAYGYSSVEMSKATVYAIGPANFYPDGIPYQGVYHDMGTGRTMVNNINPTMPFSPSQSVGGTNRNALVMGKRTIKGMVETLKARLALKGISLDDIMNQPWAGHQPNRTMLVMLGNALAEELGISPDLIPFIGQKLNEAGEVVDYYGITCGNTSAPANLLSLIELVNSGRVSLLELFVLMSLGYGNHCSGVVIIPVGYEIPALSSAKNRLPSASPSS